MILNNIKNNQKKSGFTIVELLVVIVVIGILAAITIVSYTGITAKANTAKAQSNAQSAQQVIEVYAADNSGAYPATLAAISGYSGTTKMPADITVSGGLAATSADGTTVIRYATDGTTGGKLSYWDATSGGSSKTIYLGAAKSGDTFVAAS